MSVIETTSPQELTGQNMGMGYLRLVTWRIRSKIEIPGKSLPVAYVTGEEAGALID